MELKLLCEFSKDKHMSDGHMYVCRVCNREKTHQWQKNNKIKRNLNSKKNYIANEEKRIKKIEKNKCRNKKIYYANLELSRKTQNEYKKLNIEKTKINSAKNRKKHYFKILEYNARRKASKLQATPAWLTGIQKMQLQWFYAAAKMMSETSGIKHHVDHIHPLQGDGFNGLHVPWNLRVIKASENISKHNNLLPEEKHLMWEV